MIVAAKYDQDWNLHEVMKILMDEWRVGHSFESNPDQKSLRCFLWILNSRYTEYRQDAFAHELGFGLELKQVLQKILETSPPQRVDQYSILMRSTHPITHNRIRRLEKLAGFRK